jgi:maltose O-acetyltransferase
MLRDFAGRRLNGAGRANGWQGRVVSRLRGEADARRLVARGLRLGRNVFINRSARLDGGFLWLISIGDESVVGPCVQILAHDATTRRRLGYSIVAPVAIGRRVFVGAGSIILPGVTIGDDVIVGAGSVVRSEVPDGSLVVGNPATLVGTTDDYFARHREEMRVRPRWPAEGWTVLGGITDENQSRMLEALRDGHGYVE